VLVVVLVLVLGVTVVLVVSLLVRVQVVLSVLVGVQMLAGGREVVMGVTALCQQQSVERPARVPPHYLPLPLPLPLTVSAHGAVVV
jgi:hypothetical protein